MPRKLTSFLSLALPSEVEHTLASKLLSLGLERTAIVDQLEEAATMLETCVTDIALVGAKNSNAYREAANWSVGVDVPVLVVQLEPFGQSDDTAIPQLVTIESDCDAIDLYAAAVAAQHQFLAAKNSTAEHDSKTVHDPSAQNQNKRLLQQARILNLVSDAIITTDAQLVVTSWNTGAENIYGYTENEVIGHKLGNLLQTRFPSGLPPEKALQQLFETGSWQGDVVQVGKNGRQLEILSSVNLIKGPDGEPQSIVAINRDITDLIRIQEALLQSERYLEKAHKIARLGTWNLNLRSGRMKWSPEMNSFFGLEPSVQLTPELLKSFIDPDDLAIVEAETARAIEEIRPFSLEVKVRRKSGSVGVLLFHIDMECDREGKPDFLIGLARDITEERQAEVALAQLARFPDENPDPVLRINSNNELVYANRSATAFKNHIVQPNGQIRTDLKVLIQNVVEGSHLSEVEYPIDARTYLLAIVYLAGWDYVNVYARDITERKRAETQLLHKNRELETFIYKASHDLKGPLSSTQGLVNVGKMMVQDPQIVDLLDKVSESTAKLESILEDLTQVALIQQGKVNVVPVHFAELVMDAITHFSDYPHFGTINFDIQDDLFTDLKSDPKLLKTIMRNLLENAIKYCDPRKDGPFVRIVGKPVENGAMIDVEDNGLGIPKDMQEKVFDMFFRASDAGKGSGLGLYIVKNALEKLGGNLTMDSEHGEGTSFKMFIPDRSAVQAASNLNF